MNRIRIATTAVAVLAAGLFLLGCGTDAVNGTWHAAPTPAGGHGGGSGAATLVTTGASTAPGSAADPVVRTTETADVALTFDDGPDPKHTPEVLALLREHNVQATFCLVGVQVQEFPQLVRDIVADGHMLCNHTWRHDLRLGQKGEETVRADLQRTQDAIMAAAPHATVRYFRHPGGNFTPTAVAVAASMGMTSIGWEVDTDDWNLARYGSGPAMRDHVLATLRATVKPGSIVLAHDAGGDRSGTVAAFAIALPELKSRFTLVALA